MSDAVTRYDSKGLPSGVPVPRGESYRVNQESRFDALEKTLPIEVSVANMRHSAREFAKELKRKDPQRFDEAMKERGKKSISHLDEADFTFFTGEMLTTLTNELIEAQYEPKDAKLFLNEMAVGNPWVDKFRWHQVDYVGAALRGANFHNTADIPSVDGFIRERESNFLYNFVKYSWTLKDAQAPYELVNHLALKQKAARDVLERDADSFHLYGDSRFVRPDGSTMLGLFNNVYNQSTRPDGIQVLSTNAAPIGSSFITGGWAAKLTPAATNANRDDVLKDFQLIDEIFRNRINAGNAEGGNERPDSVVLPDNIWQRMGWSRFDGDRAITLLEILQKSMPTLQNVYFHAGLNALGAGSTGRALFYRKNELGNYVHPIPYEEIPVQQNVFSNEVHAFGIMGPVVIKKPMYGMYVDGI